MFIVALFIVLAYRLFFICAREDQAFPEEYPFTKADPTERYIDDRFVEFVGKKVFYNEDLAKIEERYRLTVQLVTEAHSKYNFKSGIVYLNNDDLTRNNDVLFKNIYYIAYDVKYHVLYSKVSGPGFSCVGWPSAEIPSFEKETKDMIESSTHTPLWNKIGWVGNVGTSPHRPLLLKMAVQHPQKFNFTHFPAEEFMKHSKHYVAMHDLVRDFAFLLDIEGVGYSGRLKYLLYSNRPLFIVERRIVEWFNIELIPYFHYIPVKNDLSDLIHQFDWVMENQELAKEIAANALHFAKLHMNHDAFLKRLGKSFDYMLRDDDVTHKNMRRQLQLSQQSNNRNNRSHEREN